MGPIFYVMAILGCGEADAACQQVDTVRAQYSSMAECNAATGAEVERRLDLAYPVVVAQCQQSNNKLAAVSAEDVKLPTAEGNATVRPASGSTDAKFQLASRR